MTKESILKRLFFNNQITLDELLVLVDAKYKEKNLGCKDPIIGPGTSGPNQFVKTNDIKYIFNNNHDMESPFESTRIISHSEKEFKFSKNNINVNSKL